jgi:hypothetical protein
VLILLNTKKHISNNQCNKKNIGVMVATNLKLTTFATLLAEMLMMVP